MQKMTEERARPAKNWPLLAQIALLVSEEICDSQRFLFKLQRWCVNDWRMEIFNKFGLNWRVLTAGAVGPDPRMSSCLVLLLRKFSSPRWPKFMQYNSTDSRYIHTVWYIEAWQSSSATLRHCVLFNAATSQLSSIPLHCISNYKLRVSHTSHIPSLPQESGGGWIISAPTLPPFSHTPTLLLLPLQFSQTFFPLWPNATTIWDAKGHMRTTCFMEG